MPVEVVDDVGCVSELSVYQLAHLVVEECVVEKGEGLSSSRHLLCKMDVLCHVRGIRQSCNVGIFLYLLPVGKLHSGEDNGYLIDGFHIITQGGICGLVADGDYHVQLALAVGSLHYLLRLGYFLSRCPSLAVEITESHVGNYIVLVEMLQYNALIVNEVVTAFCL